MELKEYLDSIPDVERQEDIRAAFDQAIDCIHLAAIHRAVTEIPIIRIVDDGYFDVYASESYGSITLHAGVIDYFYDVKLPILSEFVVGANVELDVKWALRLGICWVLSHEFTHIIRKHDSTKVAIRSANRREIDRKYLPALDLSDAEYLKGTEHDADLCAVAMVYRHLQLGIKLEATDVILKKIVFFSVFAGIRGWPEYENGGSHADLFERLYHLAMKLAYIGIPTVYDSAAKEGVRKALETMREMAELAVRLENSYSGYEMDYRGLTELKEKWSSQSKDVYINQVRWWQAISPWVEKVSGIQADNNDTIFEKIARAKAEARLKKKCLASARKTKRRIQSQSRARNRR